MADLVAHSCRHCGLAHCDCNIVPSCCAHLTIPNWLSVKLDISNCDISINSKSKQLRSSEQIRQSLSERNEAAIGIGARYPVETVKVFSDSMEVMRYVTVNHGDWCVAMPAEPKPLLGGEIRLISYRQGVITQTNLSKYGVVTHNWPRGVSANQAHLSVLGIWWPVDSDALRKAETSLAISHKYNLPIWIDFLCIDQSSHSDKSAIIPQMGTIFAQSSNGFIDCTTTPTIKTIEPSCVVEMLNSSPKRTSREEIASQLQRVVESPWFTRCWTFQEELLAPQLLIFNPSTCEAVGTFRDLQHKCIEQFHLLHETQFHNKAKNEDWFSKAASLLSHDEILNGRSSWCVGNILTIRGNRESSQECDQVNSLLGLINIKCNIKHISATREFSNHTFSNFLEDCGKQGDLSWLGVEDGESADRAKLLPWTPQISAHFSTQCEPKSFILKQVTSKTVSIVGRSRTRAVAAVPIVLSSAPADLLIELRRLNVCSHWLLEYCGCVFGKDVSKLPVINAVSADRLLNLDHTKWNDVENHLCDLLPDDAKWRGLEFKKYLTGFAGRFNNWIICETGQKRIALLARTLTCDGDFDIFSGFPARSKFSNAHSYQAYLVVSPSKICTRLGWVWPALHASVTISPPESSEDVITIWRGRSQ